MRAERAGAPPGRIGRGEERLGARRIAPALSDHPKRDEAARLLPIHIDASPLSWDNDLRVELARAINGLSADERAQLGAATTVESDDTFSWLSAGRTAWPMWQPVSIRLGS